MSVHEQVDMLHIEWIMNIKAMSPSFNQNQIKPSHLKNSLYCALWVCHDEEHALLIVIRIIIPDY